MEANNPAVNAAALTSVGAAQRLALAREPPNFPNRKICVTAISISPNPNTVRAHKNNNRSLIVINI